MMRLLLFAFVLCACDGSAPRDECACSNAQCTCDGSIVAACTTANSFSPCTAPDAACMGCSQGAGYWCTCRTGGVLPDAGGPQWLCLGTGNACTGETR